VLITRIETIPVAIPYAERIRERVRSGWGGMEPPVVRTAVYRVTSDEGHVGVAESPEQGGEELAAFVGRNPLELLRDDRVGPIQAALYDLVGRSAGLPAHRLLGPQHRSQVASAFWSHAFAPDDLADEARIAAASGFTVHKIKARPYTDPVAQLAAIAAVAPAGYRVAIDANGSWATAAEATGVIRALAAETVLWALETPIPQDDIAGYQLLRSRFPYPIGIHTGRPPMLTAIAAGMCDAFVIELEGAMTTLEQAAIARATSGTFARAVVDRSVDVPRWVEDAAGTGLEQLFGAHLVSTPRGLPIWIENGLYSGLSAAFQLHLAATIPNDVLAITLTFLLEDDLTVEPLVIRDGFAAVPAGPGLGVTLDENALDRYRTGRGWTST